CAVSGKHWREWRKRRHPALASGRKYAPHAHVVNPGILEYGALGHEALPRVEVARVDLRGERHLKVTAPPRLVDQCAEQQGSYPFPTEFLAHRHAANVTIGKEATGGRCPTVGCIHQRVCADRITLVHFFFHRNLLLLYEHFVANCGGRLGVLLPTAQNDSIAVEIGLLIAHFGHSCLSCNHTARGLGRLSDLGLSKWSGDQG